MIRLRKCFRHIKNQNESKNCKIAMIQKCDLECVLDIALTKNCELESIFDIVMSQKYDFGMEQ